MEKSDPDWDTLLRSALQEGAVPQVSGGLWRVVESQSQVATLALVDSLEEQSVLEDLIEKSKPPQAAHTAGLHYLLATPFRYPPLKWGSRFGSRFQPSLFYGSMRINTALAEAAYYRLIFWRGMAEPPPSGRLVTRHDLFSARYRACPGLKLQQAPFSVYRGILGARDRYKETQQLGDMMRQRNILGFEFVSARCPENGINVGLFDPAALVSKRPREVQHWICETAAQTVTFRGESGMQRFSSAQFEDQGQFPLPV